MSNRKLASLAVATIIAAMIASPVQAQFRGHGGGGGGGFRGAAVGGLGGGGFRAGGGPGFGFGGGGFRAGIGPGFGGGAFRTTAIGSGFVGRPGFAGRAAWWGGRTAWSGGRLGWWGGRPSWWGGRRWPFFGVGLGLAGLYAASYSSCWTWVPTAFGWQQVWTCGSSYSYGDYSDGGYIPF